MKLSFENHTNAKAARPAHNQSFAIRVVKSSVSAALCTTKVAVAQPHFKNPGF
jgi:hypothetical protein